MYKRILVTTDGSALSKKAVRSAIALCAATGADLVALHVVPRYPVSYFEGGMVTLTADDVGRLEKDWTDRGQSLVESVKEAATKAGVKVKTVLAHSDLVAEAVISAVARHKCDLVVMSSHGRRGIKRLLLGSETQNVLTHSTVPVLVLR